MSEYKEVLKETIREWGRPISTHVIKFDSQQAQLEPIYYWILDYMRDVGLDVKKVTDNFMASPGSGQFADMSQRVTRLQEEGMKMLGSINQVIKSILNLIYDLKEFKLRLSHYEDYYFGEDKKKKGEALLALKQIWLDNVDLKRGNGSIHAMAAQGGYVTLREAFMMANSQKDLDNMKSDEGEALINDVVYRILAPRLNEFFKWIDYSYKELSKRMRIEKNYLKNQVETLKLYSSWMKPYLKAAEELKQQGFEGDAALVHAFSTTMFELTLLGKKSVSPPEKFGDYHMKRKYYKVVLIDFKYRGHVSQRVTQKGDYGFAVGGRVEMTFDAYALHEEEFKLVEKEMAKKDVSDALKFSGDVAEETLREIKEDLDELLKDDDPKKLIEEEKKKKEKENADDLNPFVAIWNVFFGWTKGKGLGGFGTSSEKKEINSFEDMESDNFIEKSVRAIAAKDATDSAFNIYDIYKKAHGMASTGQSFENADDRVDEPGIEFSDVFKRIK